MKNKSLLLLTLTSAILSFGSSIMWTGLPVFVAKLTGNIEDVGYLFIVSTISGILLSLVGGYLADMISRKKIALFCLIFNSLLFLFLWSFISPKIIWIIYIVGLIEAGVNSLGTISTGTWFNNIAKQNGILESSIGFKGFINSGAKLIGMSLGPLLFLNLEEKTLLISAIAYLAGALLICFIPKPQVVKDSIVNKREKFVNKLFKGFSILFTQKKYRNLLIISVVSGMFTFPIINISLVTLKSVFDVKDNYISLFWLVGSAGSLIGNFILSKKILKKYSRISVFLTSSIAMFIGIVLMSISNTPLLFILFFALYTITNPIINNLVMSELFRKMDDENQGRITAADYTLTDLVTIGILALFNTFSTHLTLPLALLIALPFILLRVIFGYSVFMENKQFNQSNSKNQITS